MNAPSLIIVGGRPGAGKTTLSRALAPRLGVPLISRDEINDAVKHTYHDDPVRGEKGTVAKAAYDAFFATLTVLLSAGASVVAEAAYQNPLWQPGLGPLLPLAAPRVIRCTTHLHRRPSQDPARPFVPLAVPGAPELIVDTTDGYRPSLAEIAAFAAAR